MTKNQTLKTCAASAAIAALIVTAPGMDVLAGEFSAKSAPTHGAPAVLVTLPAINTGGLGVGSLETPKLAAITGAPGTVVPNAPAFHKEGTAAGLQPGAAAMTASAMTPSAANAAAPSATIQASAPGMTAVQAAVRQDATGSAQQREQAQEETGRIVFDGAGKIVSMKEASAPVEGSESRSGSGLSRSGGRRIVSRVAGMAVLLTPTLASASDGSSSGDGVSGWVIAAGAAIAGGTIALIANTVRKVAATLDAQPSELEIARYRRAEKILELDKHAQGTFDGERLPPPGMREVFNAEIVKVSGKDAKAAVADAHAVTAAFRKQYSAFTHPVLAAIVRSFRKPGDGPDSGVPPETKAEHREASRRESELRRTMTLAGVGSKDAPLPSEEHARMASELVKVSERRRAIETEYPILAKSSVGMKVVGAATGAGIGGLLAYWLALVSPGAAILAAIVAALGGLVGLNVWLFNRASPEQRAKMGEMFRNMSQTK